MVVNEKGLLRAMREAYKAGVYKVAAENKADIHNIMIAAPGWVVVIEKKNMPQKALGMIAEHLGKIPEPGEAYQVQKKQTQTEIFDVAMEMLLSIRSGEKQRRKASCTDLTMGGYNLWQRHEDLKVVKVNADLQDIMLTHGRTVLMIDDDMLMVDGLVSRVYIECATNLWADETAQLNHLAQMQWVAT